MRARGRVVGILAAMLLTACVAPALSYEGYAQQATMTAADAVSAARTAVLATRTDEQGRMTGAALLVLVQESEAALGTLGSTFDSVQPPDDGRSDALRRELDGLLQDAQSAVQDLRIAARRGDDAAMSLAAAALATAGDALADFEELHQP